MAKIGRNEKCICGSGKKYKNCCMIKEQNKVNKGKQEGFAEQEAASLITNYINSPENIKDFNIAIEKYFGSAFSNLNISQPQFNMFVSWYIKGYNISKPIIDKIIERNNFLDEKVDKLLNELKASYLCLYEVIELKAEIITFKSFYNEKKYLIKDDILAQNISIGDILYSRIYQVDEYYRIFGGSIFVPKELQMEIIHIIDMAKGESNPYEKLEELSLEIIKKLNSQPQINQLVNEDNEMLQYSVCVYEIKESIKVKSIIEGIKNLKKSIRTRNSYYQWYKLKDKQEIVLAEISIEENQIKVETDSLERLTGIQALLEEKLKDLILSKKEEYLTIEQLQGIEEREKAEAVILDKMKNEYTPIQIREALKLLKQNKDRLNKVKPQSLAAAVEYIIANEKKLLKTQRDIADKYDVSAGTIAKWSKNIKNNF